MSFQQHKHIQNTVHPLTWLSLLSSVKKNCDWKLILLFSKLAFQTIHFKLNVLLDTSLVEQKKNETWILIHSETHKLNAFQMSDE